MVNLTVEELYELLVKAYELGKETQKAESK